MVRLVGGFVQSRLEVMLVCSGLAVVCVVCVDVSLTSVTRWHGKVMIGIRKKVSVGGRSEELVR